MAEARRRDEWDRSAVLLSLIYNSNRGPKSPYLPPQAFHPYVDRPVRNENKPRVGVEALKVFLPNGGKRR